MNSFIESSHHRLSCTPNPFIYSRLMNDVRFGLLSNHHRLLKLVLISGRNHWELLRYFHYHVKGPHYISLLESISSNIKGQ